MAFEPTPFISAAMQALRSHGFIQSAATIEGLIRYGVPARDTDEMVEASPTAQNELAALVIEQNIIEPYHAWEEAVEIVSRSTGVLLDEANADEFLMICDGRSLAPLGSFAYRNTIGHLAAIVGYLRGGPPPAPRGGGRGGPPGGPSSGQGPSGFASETVPLLTSSPQMPLPISDLVQDYRSVDFNEIYANDFENQETEQVETIRLWP
ncbi:hypothetical protein V7799_00450 [Rhizobium laguerreae]